MTHRLGTHVDFSSPSLPPQERLTREVAAAVQAAAAARGVAVVVEACHMCMVMRGVQKINSKTVTSCMLGAFKADPKARKEFFAFIKQVVQNLASLQNIPINQDFLLTGNLD